MDTVVRYTILDVLDWNHDLTTDSLRQTLTDRASEDLGLVDEEGKMLITIEGDEYVVEFVPGFGKEMAELRHALKNSVLMTKQIIADTITGYPSWATRSETPEQCIIRLKAVIKEAEDTIERLVAIKNGN